MSKQRLSPAETALVIDGLGALAREYEMLANHAARLGDPGLARSLRAKATEATALWALAQSVKVERLTARYSY